MGCHLRWTYPSTSTDSEGNITNVDADEDQWIYDRVTLKAGETRKIVGWDQGR